MAPVEIVVRTEPVTDHASVRRIVAEAFAAAEHSAPPVEDDGVPGEASLVGWLRDSDAYDPRFALVACDGDVVVGFAMATWGDLDSTPVLGIGPVAVAPNAQGEGVGAALVRELLARAASCGERVVVLLGDPGYYARFGFVPAGRLGIEADPEWGDYFQACPLGSARRGGVGSGGDPAAGVTMDATAYTGPRGTFTYPQPFSRLG